MAKKIKTEVDTTIEEVVEPLKLENSELETINVEDAKPESIKPRTIITKTRTLFRKIPSLESKYIVGNMVIGTSYEIKKEVNSKIYGSFYQLSNGYYIVKDGNYSIN